MNICVLVGKNIKSVRKKKGLSQEELAHRAHIDRPYLSQIENGKRNITLLVLQEIAVALDVAPEHLFSSK